MAKSTKKTADDKNREAGLGDIAKLVLDVWADLVRNSVGLRCVVLTRAGKEAF